MRDPRSMRVFRAICSAKSAAGRGVEDRTILSADQPERSIFVRHCLVDRSVVRCVGSGVRLHRDTNVVGRSEMNISVDPRKAVDCCSKITAPNETANHGWTRAVRQDSAWTRATALDRRSQFKPIED
jgi:hypothetical protein